MKIIFRSDEDVALLFENMTQALRNQILRTLKDWFIGKPWVYDGKDKVYVTDIEWSRVPRPAFYIFAESKTGWVVNGYWDEFRNLNGKPIRVEVEL